MRYVPFARIALALAVVLGGGLIGDATAQEYGGPTGARSSRARSDGGFWGLEFEVRGGVLLPDGSTSFTATPPQEDDSYDEYWSMGIGGGADVALPLFLSADPQGSTQFTLGPFLGFDFYQLTGDDKSYPGGGVLAVDNWTATTFFGGAQVRLLFGGEGNMVRMVTGLDVAAGMVSYGGVSADFIATPGATPTVGHIFDSSITSALRGVVRLGFDIRFSDHTTLVLHAMGGILMLGAPDGNTDTLNPFGDSKPDAWNPLIAAVGCSLRFRF